jgi:LacI family transcriptional regulator
MPKFRHIAALIGAERQYFRGVLQGIARFSRLHGGWELVSEPSYQSGLIPADQLRYSDGVFVSIRDQKQLVQVRKWKFPIINLASMFPEEPFGHVSNNGTTLAKLAIEHFIERGFKHFGYCEIDSNSYFRSRRFMEQTAARGLDTHIYRVAKQKHTDWIHGHDRPQLEAWLKILPKPIGILAHNDVRGRHLADACRRLEISVPDDVAILGVDNELPHCEMSLPALSSIVTDAERIGFEAATLLDQMIEGPPPEQLRILIPPIGIVTRQSTDVTATTDPNVADAVKFIREYAFEGIDVGDVLQHVVISRTALDKRFLEVLGRTPHEEILRVRLKRAKEFLQETNLTIEIIAEKVGFKHGEYLGAVFMRVFGQTPGQFREQSRQHSTALR